MTICRIESASTPASERTTTLSGAPGRSGTVSVTTICSNGTAGEVLVGLPREEPVRRRGVDARCALVEHRLRRGPQRAGGVDDVVHDHRGLSLDVADHVADLGHLLSRALLRHQRQVGTDRLRELVVQLHAADVRRRRPRGRRAAGRRSTCASTSSAVMWSTGLVKKPCTWPAWRSTVSTRSAPAVSST